MLMYDKYTWNVCDNVRVNIIYSVLEMPTEIIDQFAISSSFNGIALNRFVTLHMKCLEKCSNEIYLCYDW